MNGGIVVRYIVDNDLHIHSKISICSSDEKQTNERILEYAKKNNFNTICLTNHFWDEKINGAFGEYVIQNYSHIAEAKPLPQSSNVRFLFGCETELDKTLTLGLSREKFSLFDFIVIPTTHFHMKTHTLSEEELKSSETRAKAWVNRLDAVLNMDLPFYKIGIAHLTCGLIAPTRKEYIEVLRIIPEDEMKRLFKKAAELGVGIELNSKDMGFSFEEADVVLRPYRIAKECGCKFYCGSDAHHPEMLDGAKNRFEKAVDMLCLTENDKFKIKGI